MGLREPAVLFVVCVVACETPYGMPCIAFPHMNPRSKTLPRDGPRDGFPVPHEDFKRRRPRHATVPIERGHLPPSLPDEACLLDLNSLEVSSGF